MKPRLVALNVLLAAGVLAIGWQARVRWNDAQAARKANLNVPVRRVTPPPVTPVPKPEAPPATKYEDVAKKNLFSSDRNADIIIDPPKIEAPKPMPHLPVVYGVMTLPSGTKASMAEKPGEPSRMVKANDTIGEFKIVALDAQNVTFEWNGKQLPHKIEDLIDRSNPQTSSSAQTAAAPSGPAVPPPAAPQPKPVNANPTSADLGKELTPTARACQPGDTSPAGAVVDGYKKTVQQTIFGAVCRWVKQ